MKTLQVGPLRVRAAGGSDRDGGGNGPAVLLCHGFGAPGDDLVPLHRAIDPVPGLRWFFPEAPLALDMGMGMQGRAWWNIDMMKLQLAMMRGLHRELASEHPEGMPAAVDALRLCIQKLHTDHGVEPSRLVVGGFSQGAMITTELALHAEVPFAGLALLSGTLLCEGRWRAAAKEKGAGLRVYQSHGRHDPILPYAGAEGLRGLLTEHGATVTFRGFPGQHEIPYPVLEGLGDFVKERLGGGAGG